MVYLYAIFGMFCAGLAPILGKMGLYNVNPVTALCLRTLVASTLVMFWLAFSRGLHQLFQVSPWFWLILGVEGVLAILIGDFAYFLAIKKGSLNQVVLIMACSPLVTMLFSFLFFDEVVSLGQLFGAFMVAGGLILILRG